MRYRQLDGAGDYTIGAFHVDSPAAVAQAIQTRLRLYAGEWFLDSTDGTPWRTDVLGKYTRETYDTIIQQRILGTPGVSSIDTYASAFDGTRRALTVSATVSTAYGQTTITATL